MTHEEGGAMVPDAQSTEAHGADHILVIPPEGYYNLYHSDTPVMEEQVRERLVQWNTGGVMLSPDAPNPARIQAKIDGIECDIWFTPDPSLPVNPRARGLVADVFGWHMVFHGAVAITNLPEETVAEYIAAG